jgi:hypothetical protein
MINLLRADNKEWNGTEKQRIAFTLNWHSDSKGHVETQMTCNSQNNIEKEKVGRLTLLDFRLLKNL